jgi:hypothetical protein
MYIDMFKISNDKLYTKKDGEFAYNNFIKGIISPGEHINIANMGNDSVLSNSFIYNMLKDIVSNYESKDHFLKSITISNQTYTNNKELVRGANRLYPK